MCAKWNNNYNPNVLAQLIDSEIKRNPSGPSAGLVGFGWRNADYESVLQDSISLDKGIPELEAQRIISAGMWAAAKLGRVTAESLKVQISKEEHTFLKLPRCSFVIISAISLERSEVHKRRVSSRSTVCVGGASRIKFDRTKILDRSKNFFRRELPIGYVPVRIFVKARTSSEAGHVALEDFDLVRAIWNFANNRRTMRRSSFPPQKRAVNEIMSGPIHTIHKTTGELATSMFFYEPTYRGKVSPPRAHNFQAALKAEKWINEYLRLSHYRPILEQALRRYGRALDDTDLNAAFLRLWSVLELLTNTSKHYLTIDRCAFLHEDRVFAKLHLEHLRRYRNQHVHAAAESHQIESLVWQLKHHVEVLLDFHLANYRWFKNLEDAAAFMDSPTEKKTLQRVMKFLRYA